MLVPAASPETAWHQQLGWRFPENEVRAEPESLSLAIIGAARLVRPRLSASMAAAVDLQEQEAMILLGLGIGGPRLRTELARLLQSDGAAIGRSVKVLLRSGFAEGQTSGGAVSLGPKGEQAFAELGAILLDFERRALDGIKTPELTRARAALCAAHLATAKAGGSKADAPPDAICGRFIFQMILTSRLVSRVAADLSGSNGSRPPFEARILAELSPGPLAQSVLAYRLGSDKGQLSRTIGAMLSNGLLRIEKIGRHRILHLTTAGYRASRRFASKLATLEDACRARIEPDGRTALLGVLDRIGTNLR